MAVRIVRLGSPRAKNEGLRIGTVRRPPRGVPKNQFAKRDYYALWAIRTYLFELRRRIEAALLRRADRGYKRAPAIPAASVPSSDVVLRAGAAIAANN